MEAASSAAGVLEAKRSSIDRAIRRIKSELADSYPEERFELERSLCQLQPILDRITSAVKRAQKGCYGLCEDCGEPIDRARLHVVPWATRCMTCESRSERRRHLSAKVPLKSARGGSHA